MLPGRQGWLKDPDAVLAQIEQHIQWQSETLMLFGQRRLVPRQVAWAGDTGVCYRYSGCDHRASGWPAVLRSVRDELQALFNARYNFVLLNRYRNGEDSMGWHADDEPALRGDVASVSLGCPRRFRYELADGTRVSVLLPHGSVIEIPRTLRHCVPRMRRAAGARVNLSFRWVSEQW